MKRVLVATDLSAEADEAIRQADVWARALDADLIAYHVMPPPPVPQLPPGMLPVPVPDTRAARAEAMAAVHDRLLAITGRHDCRYEIVVEDGAPRAAVAEGAETLSADLVVLGAHQHHRLLEHLRGGVASSVIRHARHAAVLVARPSPPTRRVLSATDFSDPALPTLTTAFGIARRMGGRMIALHCIDEPTTWVAPMAGGPLSFDPWPAEARRVNEAKARARLHAAMESTGAVGEARIVFGPPAVEIVHLAREQKAELVVVGTVGRKGLGRLVLGNTAEAVVRNAPCSVLVERLHRPAA